MTTTKELLTSLNESHMPPNNELLQVSRLEKHLDKHYEIKDPSVVQVADGSYLMYASIGNSITQEWLVGRFSAVHPTGTWQELEPVEFTNLSGPQLCAPAVTYSNKDGKDKFEMYIQTACFEEDGQIVYATSQDGQKFEGQTEPIVTKYDLNDSDKSVVGVYDVGVSEISQDDQVFLCMLYSGYRRVGCGDIYASFRKKEDEKAIWSRGERIITQEDVPFHNRPDYEHFEWGLEGAKLIQLAKDAFVIIGVCFLPKPNEYLGSRQRVFMAASSNMNGPYVPIGLPFTPRGNSEGIGENGHPDTIIEGDNLWVIYQERQGDGKPWYLRCASMHLPSLESFVRGKLSGEEKEIVSQQIQPDQYHFDHRFLSL